MRFALRDDDTNFFTRPRQIEQIYAGVWDRCPVSLAVVPFQGCARSGAVPAERWSGVETFPLDRNEELVAYLRGKIREGRVSILLHGSDHVDRAGRPEFASDMSAAAFSSRIAAGRRYLEELLDTTITAFVPPHNAMSREALAALAGLSMNVLGTFSFRPGLRPISPSILAPLARRRLFLWRHRRRGWRGGFYPYPLEVGGHRELACHGLNHDPACSPSDLSLKLDQTQGVGGDFCLAVHYWELSDPLLFTWLQLILHRAESLGAEFVHADDLFRAPSARTGREAAA